MNKLRTFLIAESGWLTKEGRIVLFWGGLALMVGALYLISSGYMNYFVLGIMVGLGTAMTATTKYEWQAKRAGFQPPFTEDPLGWRRAKSTYPPVIVMPIDERDDGCSTAQCFPATSPHPVGPESRIQETEIK